MKKYTQGCFRVLGGIGAYIISLLYLVIAAPDRFFCRGRLRCAASSSRVSDGDHAHCSQRTLNGVAEAQVDILGSLIRIDTHEVARVFSLRRLQELAVVRHLRVHASHVAGDELRADAFIGGFGLLGREELPGGLMQLHARELVEHAIVADLQRDHLLRLDFEVAQQLDLLHVEWAPVKYPPIQAAVRLAEPLIHQVNDYIVRHDSVLSNVALKLAGVVIVIVSPSHLLYELLDLHVDHLVLLSDAKRVGFLLGARGAHQNNALWAAGRIRVLQFEYTVDLLNDSHLARAALELGDEALADVLDAADLQVVFKHCIVSDSLPLRRVIDPAHAWLVLFPAQVAQDSVQRALIVLIQQDELVGDHAHLLQGDRLAFSPWEPLYDPTLLPLLHLIDLLLDELDHDLVLDVTVRFQRLLDILAVLLVLLRDLPSDQVSHGDALEVLAFLAEVRGEAERDLLALRAGWSNEYNPRSYIHYRKNG